MVCVVQRSMANAGESARSREPMNVKATMP